jgi:hypothetical protein
MKHTKIDTLIDSGSQSDLISEEVVKKLGLNTKMHHKPYSLNWIRKDHKFPITKQCIIMMKNKILLMKHTEKSKSRAVCAPAQTLD